jgi:hypothetical protein
VDLAPATSGELLEDRVHEHRRATVDDGRNLAVMIDFQRRDDRLCELRMLDDLEGAGVEVPLPFREAIGETEIHDAKQPTGPQHPVSLGQEARKVWIAM